MTDYQYPRPNPRGANLAQLLIAGLVMVEIALVVLTLI
jgi:hypothetical protein